MFNTYNNYINELCQIILEDQFPNEVASIAIEMLSLGPASLQEIAKKLNSDFLTIRNALIILIQNKFCLFQEVKRKETKEILYEIDLENVLNVLRYPKILYFINLRYGQNAVQIFEEFMQYGVLSFKQCIEQIKYKLNKSSINHSLRSSFITLIENNFILQASKIKNEEIKPKIEKKKVKKEDEVNLSNKKKKKLKKEETDSEGDNIKNNTIEDDHPLIYNIDKQKPYYFNLNIKKIINELKIEFIIDFIVQKLNGNQSNLAGLISSIMIRKNPREAFISGKTEFLSIESIYKEMNANHKNSFKPANIKELLDKMCLEENDLAIVKFEEYSLNVDSIVKILKNKTIQKIIEQQFSSNHTRIYRLLSRCGALDSKNIMEICLFSQKECASYLNQMIEENLIETQTINIKGGNVIFYSINNLSNIENMIGKIFKIIRNLKYCLKSELEKIKNIESEYMQEQYITKIYGMISELDDSIMILKFYEN